MTPMRTAALVLAATAAGCTKPTPFPDPKPVAAYKADAVPPPTPAAIPAPAPAGDAAGFATKFLTAVHAGTATPDMLTPEFKKVVAEPVFGDDREKGYSDAAAGQWLLTLRGTVPLVAYGLNALGDTGAVAVLGSGGAPPFTLRLVRVGTEWKADWFLSATGVEVGRSTLPTRNDPCFAATAFLEALLAKNDRLAEGLLGPSYKGALAPPFASDKRGYNRGILDGKLASVRGRSTGYAVTKIDGTTVTAELTGGGAARTIRLTFGKGPRTWDWLIQDMTTAD